MKFVVELQHIGQSTYEIKSSLFDGEDETFVSSCCVKLTRVNFKTRKSEPLPSYFHEKYSQYCPEISSLTPLDRNLNSPPALSFSASFPARYSDTDWYEHITSSVYVKLCQDCATMASVKGGYLKGFSGDICTRQVKSVRCGYVSESRAGSVLTVTVWQDESLQEVLHFQITREGILSMVCLFEFHPQEEFTAKL